MNVTIYSTASCGFCKMLKKYLDSKNIAYTVKMADEDEKVAQELFEKSKGFAVPFTEIVKDDGQVDQILGYDLQKLNLSLGL